MDLKQFEKHIINLQSIALQAIDGAMQKAKINTEQNWTVIPLSKIQQTKSLNLNAEYYCPIWDNIIFKAKQKIKNAKASKFIEVIQNPFAGTLVYMKGDIVYEPVAEMYLKGSIVYKTVQDLLSEYHRILTENTGRYCDVE